MLFKYDPSNNFLLVNNTIVPSYDLTENLIGTCSFCDAQIISQSYHDLDDNTAVVAYCEKCGASFINLYDREWNWISEQPISHFFSYKESTARNGIPNGVNSSLGKTLTTQIFNVPMNKLTPYSLLQK